MLALTDPSTPYFVCLFRCSSLEIEEAAKRQTERWMKLQYGDKEGKERLDLALAECQKMTVG